MKARKREQKGNTLSIILKRCCQRKSIFIIYLIINNGDIIMTCIKGLPSSQFSDSDTLASLINLHLSPLCRLLYSSIPPSFSSTLMSSPSLSSFIHLFLFITPSLSFTISFHPSPLLLYFLSVPHPEEKVTG